MPDIISDQFLISTYRRDKIPSCPKTLTNVVLFSIEIHTHNMDGTLTLNYPTACDTAYFGGIEIIICTWSGIKWPSSIWLSFCLASQWNTSLRSRRIWPNIALRRYLGMNSIWYLHSHRVWLKLSTCLMVSPLRGPWRLTLWSYYETCLNVKLCPPPQQSWGGLPLVLGKSNTLSNRWTNSGSLYQQLGLYREFCLEST